MAQKGKLMKCYDCGRPSRIKVLDPNGRPICSDCIKKHYITCHDCGKLSLRNYSYAILGSEESRICRDCFTKNYWFCNGCRRAFKRDEHIPLSNHRSTITFCQVCFPLYKAGSIYIESKHTNAKYVNETLASVLCKEPILRYNSFNKDSPMLSKISKAIGIVTDPVYLYGLDDSNKYSIGISPTLLDKLIKCEKKRKLIIEQNYDPYRMKGFCGTIQVANEKPYKYSTRSNKHYMFAIGLSKKIRTGDRDGIIKLIRAITVPIKIKRKKEVATICVASQDTSVSEKTNPLK